MNKTFGIVNSEAFSVIARSKATKQSIYYKIVSKIIYYIDCRVRAIALPRNDSSIRLFLPLIIITIFLLSGCIKQDAAIFLSENPVNLNNLATLQESPTFKVRQRIYFTLVSKQPIESPVLRLQTIKLDNKYNYPIPQMEIPYAVDMERGSNPNVVSDYFVLHQDGTYFIRIFSLDNLDKPIAEAEFFVEKR